MPVDTRLLSHCPHPHPLQSLGQWHRRQGCLCTRRHPQRDEDHAPIVRHSPEPELSLRPLSMPLDTAVLSPFPFHPSPAVSTRTTSVQKEQLLSWTASRATRRCKCSSRLRGARTGPKCSPLCQRPLTRLLSHHPHPTPCSQSRRKRHRIRGRLCARGHPQGDADHQLRVRRRPSVRFCVNAH
jgi:hypothetical protein